MFLVLASFTLSPFWAIQKLVAVLLQDYVTQIQTH